jgi:hypothetical protein
VPNGKQSEKRNIVVNNALSGFNDIFKNTTTNINGDCVLEIPLTDLYPPEFHPFQVNDDEAMQI